MSAKTDYYRGYTPALPSELPGTIGGIGQVLTVNPLGETEWGVYNPLNYSITLGLGSGVSGFYSIAQGYNSFADDLSVAFGAFSSTDSEGTAVGYTAYAGGFGSTATGYAAYAGNVYSLALGHNSYASHSGSGAIGPGAVSSADDRLTLNYKSVEVSGGSNPGFDLSTQLRLRSTFGSYHDIGVSPAGILTGVTVNISSLTQGGASTGQFLSWNGTNWVPSSPPGPSGWTTVAVNTNVTAGNRYAVNTTSGARTMTLPANPAINDSISFVDYAGTFHTNNLTIARNTKNIMGLAENMTVRTRYATFILTYIDATRGWVITA